MTPYTPFTWAGDGIQVVAITVPGWTDTYYKTSERSRDMEAACHAAIDYWRRYAWKIEFAFYGYDPRIIDDGCPDGIERILGTDGYPDAIGLWIDQEDGTDDEIPMGAHMNRYPIENDDGTVADHAYQMTFRRRDYRPDPDNDGKVLDLYAEALEHDRGYRELLFKQWQEEMELHGFHAEERVRYLVARRRARNRT